MIFKTYIDSIPSKLEEQAQIDGSPGLRVFRKIMMPLLAPGHCNRTHLQILFSWNDFDLRISHDRHGDSDRSEK